MYVTLTLISDGSLPLPRVKLLLESNLQSRYRILRAHTTLMSQVPPPPLTRE